MATLVTKVQRVTVLVPGMLILGVVLSSLAALAQLPKATAPATAAAPPAALDPLHRETPHSAVEGMLRCSEREDLACASRYLQPVPGQDMLEVARELHALRSRYRGSIATLSDDPNGRVEEGLLPGQERAGAVQIGGTTTHIILVRVDDPNYGKIWLVSSETVAQIPQLYAEMQSEGPTLAERVIPGPLNHQHLLGMSLAQWLGWLLSIPISVALAWLLAFVLSVPRRIWRAVRKVSLKLV